MNDDLRAVQKFLYGGHRDAGDFPDSTLFIGTGFEIGGAYEDWGFGVFKRVNGQMKELGAGRSIQEAINKAKVKLKCDHEWDNNNWCLKCRVHKTHLGL